MGTVTSIDSKAQADLASILQCDLQVSDSIKVPHSQGGHFIVGQKYEMFAPAAKGATANIGIAWHDDVGYSFTYEGTITMRGELYICTKDVHYAGSMIPPIVQAQFDILGKLLDGIMPLCPSYVGAKIIRPATDE